MEVYSCEHWNGNSTGGIKKDDRGVNGKGVLYFGVRNDEEIIGQQNRGSYYA